MKTFSPKKQDIQRKWYIVDVKDRTLGKAATKIANILRGKNKPIFAPHVDCGDYVVVINAKDIHMTGSKVNKKKYYRHTRYPNGLKEETAMEVLNKHPERVLERAVAGMIPPNKLKQAILGKLKVYAGAEHQHEAQKPEPIKLS
ncbi:50S ribosomal protein L13 [Patescibacteria group bacterium]|nr:50S ribosomal protein L13 [Patescibacteria group bacterium]MBU1703534.1 50S ribosomal protein L13 [Patescibacteria group bacterium]MBU1953441.1 50S ribosomal protein L13 [Patescibacteria group bacterium]